MKADRLNIILPHKKYALSYAAALREGLEAIPADPEDIRLAERDLTAYLKRRTDKTRFMIQPDGSWLPAFHFVDLWLVDDEKFIGIATLVPQLNEALEKRGGNISYAIRISERGKGYGKMILKMAAPQLKLFNIKKAIITCRDDNEASAHVIEANGGSLIDRVVIRGQDVPERRYRLML